jgi:uncharacterized protein (DUF1697 family)
MPELKIVFEKQGFKNVLTYINSGNVIFDSDLNVMDVKAVCEKVIKAQFELNIPTGIITARQLEEALSKVPDWWGNDPNSKHNAIFVIPPVTAEEVCKQIGEIKPEYESIACCGEVIFWSAPIATFSRTRLTKIVSDKTLYNAITIRNANTAKKLLELAKF